MGMDSGDPRESGLRSGADRPRETSGIGGDLCRESLNAARRRQVGRYSQSSDNFSGFGSPPSLWAVPLTTIYEVPMSNRRRLLQDQAAKLAISISELREFTPATPDEAAGIETRLNDLTTEADALIPALAKENALDAKLAAMRSEVVDSCESRSAIVKTSRPASLGAEKPLIGFSSREERDSAGKWLRALCRGELRAMQEASNEDGDDLVPGELYGAIVNIVNLQSIAFQLASTFQTNSGRITLPKLGNATAAFLAEGVTQSQTDITTTGVVVTPYGLRASVAVSNDLIEDSVIDIASMISGAFARSFAAKIDYAWLQGDGTAGITGLAGAVTNEVSVANATLANLASVVGLVDPNVGSCSWVCSPAGYGQLLSAASGGVGIGVGVGRFPTVFGAPVYVTNGMPSSTFALYGDFSLSTAIAYKASGLKVEAAREALMPLDQVLFHGKQRVGVANHDVTYIAALRDNS